jgi:hypothetical protein
MNIDSEKTKKTWKILGTSIVAFAVFALMVPAGMSFAVHTTPGEAGLTMVNIFDNTHNGWNVDTNDPDTGDADPVIGFANFRPTVNGDPDNIIVVVKLMDAAPNCDYDLELVTYGNNTDGGLAKDGNHTGFPNPIGNMTTNGAGKGNSGAIVVNVSSLTWVADSGMDTYAHIDVEDYDLNCIEEDGSTVQINEYAATSHDDDIPGTILHWTQP